MIAHRQDSSPERPQNLVIPGRFRPMPLAIFLGMYEDVDQVQAAEDLFGDLIESGYLAGIITGEQQSLVYGWIRSNSLETH